MRIIGINGKARSGKDEVAKILCECFGFKKVAFADKLKELLIEYFGFTHTQLYEKKNKKSREMLQGVGNAIREYCLCDDFSDEVLKEIAVSQLGKNPKSINRKTKNNLELLGNLKRMFEENRELFKLAGKEQHMFWINYLFSNMDDDNVYVISDVRYKNEHAAIVGEQGRLMRIYRTDKPEIEAGSNHVSEIDLDTYSEWDWIINNDKKANWRELLMYECINFVRMLDSIDFFTETDKAKFKIPIG